MVYPFTPGVSVNTNTRCLVKEKPKDRERLNDLRKASTKHVGLGIRVPFTNYEGVPIEEAQELAKEPPPPKGKLTKHQKHRRRAQPGPNVDEQLPNKMAPAQRSRRSSDSRSTYGHEAQGGRRAPEMGIPEDDYNEQPSQKQSLNQPGYYSPDASRRPRRDSQYSNDQSRASRNLADTARDPRANIPNLTENRGNAAQMSVDRDGDRQQEQSRLNVKSERSKKSTREANSHQPHGRSHPGKVQVDDESTPSRATHLQEQSRPSARSLATNQHAKSSRRASSQYSSSSARSGGDVDRTKQSASENPDLGASLEPVKPSQSKKSRLPKVTE